MKDSNVKGTCACGTATFRGFSNNNTPIYVCDACLSKLSDELGKSAHLGEWAVPGEVNKWLITERLSTRTLVDNLRALTNEYKNDIVRHKASGGLYVIAYFSVLNANGGAEYAVNYHPYYAMGNEDYFTMKRVTHTSPASEFFDGRFESPLDEREE